MMRLSRISILSLLLGLTALAYDFSALQPQGHVSDFAGVIERQTKAALERYCGAVKASTGAEIAFVTVDTLRGEPIEDVANLLYRKWGIGSKETDEGLLLLLVIKDRRSRLEVGYGLEPYIPDGYAGSLLREMAPALKAGRYGDALVAAAQTLGARIAEAKGVTLQEPLPQRRRPPSGQGVPWGSVLFGVVFLLWLIGAGGRRGGGMGGFLTGMLLGNLMGRGFGGGGFHGRSSGGFGGYDSFGGFGGFGGGDSGGGGASGRW